MIKTTLIAVALLFWSCAFSQIDTINVEQAFTTNPANSIGIDPSLISEPVLQVLVDINDIDYVGKVIVMVYDVQMEVPMAMSKYDKEEIQTLNVFQDNKLVFNFASLDPSRSYRIETQVQNFQLGNLPLVTTIYQGN